MTTKSKTKESSNGQKNGNATTNDKLVKLIKKYVAAKFRKKIESVPKDKRIIIAGHKKMDIDYIGMALAIADYCIALGYEADIMSRGSSSHPQNKTMLSAFDVQTKTPEFYKENVESYGCVIFCDSPMEIATLEGVNPDIFIDHHPIEKYPKNCLNIHHEVSACCTIGYNLLMELDHEISPRVATALLLGIIKDLEPISDENKISEYDKIARQELFSIFDYDLYYHIMHKYEKSKGYLIKKGIVSEDDYYESSSIVFVFKEKGFLASNQSALLAECADEINSDTSVKFVVTMAYVDNTSLEFSIRNESDLINADPFSREVFKDKKVVEIIDDKEVVISAGGRRAAAGAKVPLTTQEIKELALASDEEKQIIINVKKKYYLERIKDTIERS